MMYGYGYGYWGMIIGTVIALVVLGGLVWLVVWAVRRTSSNSKNAYPGDGAARPQTASSGISVPSFLLAAGATGAVQRVTTRF